MSGSGVLLSGIKNEKIVGVLLSGSGVLLSGMKKIKKLLEFYCRAVEFYCRLLEFYCRAMEFYCPIFLKIFTSGVLMSLEFYCRWGSTVGSIYIF